MDIGSAIKQQMLAVLIDALGKTPESLATGGKPSGGGAGAQGAASSAAAGSAASTSSLGLNAGDIVTATVAAVEPDGGLVLAFKGGTARAELSGTALPEAARRVGARIELRVETAGATPRLAFVSVVPEAGPASRPIVPVPQQQASPAIAAAVVARAAVDAASRQASAAPLYADLAALAARGDDVLPRPAAAAATALLASRIDGERPVTPQIVRQAFERSGVLLEAGLARGDPAAFDAKALLTVLRDLLRDGALRIPAAAPDAEPPRRDGGVAAQRPAPAQLAAETDPQTIAATLGREADQALERIKLHQIASLPEPRSGPAEAQRPQQLSMEIPIALAQQTAMAGFRIERDKHSAKGGSASYADAWGVRFAIDAEMFGPVHAHVRLAGHAVSVSLWAEDPLTHGAFLAAMPSLAAALSANGLEIGDLAVFPGRPSEPKRAEPLHFLDKVS